MANQTDVLDARAIDAPIAEIDGHGDHPGAWGQTIQLKDIEKTLPLRVLSEADWRHWITKGFVVVRSRRFAGAMRSRRRYALAISGNGPGGPRDLVQEGRSCGTTR